jgi:hypothetical protein
MMPIDNNSNHEEALKIRLKDLKQKKQDLDSRHKHLKRELVQLLKVLKDKKIRVSKSHKAECLSKAAEFKEIEEKILPTLLEEIKSTKESLESISSSRKANTQTKNHYETADKAEDFLSWMNVSCSSELESELYLEQVLVNKSNPKITDRSKKVEDVNIKYFGRYYSKRDPRHRGDEGLLTQAILRAKEQQYDDKIVGGIIEIIKTYPQNTWVTCVPDKHGRSKRMQELLSCLKLRKEMSGYLFARDFFLEYTDSSFSTKGLNAKERKEKLEKNLQGKPQINLTGCNVLLLDDIVTTGATLVRGYKCLQKMGAENIYCAALANTVYYSNDK